MEVIRRYVESKDVGLILVSDDLAKPVRDDLAIVRAKKPVPLVYELPSPGSKAERVEYRELLKKVLKIG